MTSATVRTQPLLATERAEDGWNLEDPYCPTYVELPNGVIVKKVPILLTRDAAYSAWEPRAQGGGHSTITTIEDRWYGRVGTRRDLPPALDALPGGWEERIAKVRGWYEEQYAEAHRLIRQAFPNRAFRPAGMGELMAVI